MELKVSQSQVPVSYKGKYYMRSGTTTQELTGSELRAFILQKENITWDEIIIPNADIDEIDPKLVNRFTSEAIGQNRLYENVSKNNSLVTLKNLNLVNDNNQITRAAILLFGIHPKKFINTAVVKIGRFGDSDSDLISQDILEGNILEMPTKIMEILRSKYLNAPITYNGIKRLEKLEYPLTKTTSPF